MTLQGSLQEVDLPHIVDLARGMGDAVAVVLDTPQGLWTLYVEDGRVVHAEGPHGERGEDAVATALVRREGTFHLEPGRLPATRTIQRPWNAVLLDALRRLDEAGAPSQPESYEEEPMTKPKKMRERIADALEDLLNESSDIIGAAVVGVDGLIYSANFPRRDTDDNLVAAVAAAVYGLSQRSMKQTQRGTFVQTLIQGSDGYMLVRSITPQVLFVGLLPAEVNLGMAFAEARTITARLAEILQGLR
ncbi:MAG: DUF4388 domain-containing protein [Chloroflexi bacterium]|nr:DUF4388 domain-containing protein [Chloroflexota bacterium]